MLSQTEVVTFTVDRAIYGVPVERVREILDICPVAPIPRAPTYLMGLIDIRGESIPVIDLRTLLRLPDAADTPQTRILVTLMRNEGRETVVGLRTDRVIEVARLDNDEMRPMSEAEVLGWRGAAVAGIGRRNGDIVSVVDLDNLFAEIPDDMLAPPLDVAEDELV